MSKLSFTKAPSMRALSVAIAVTATGFLFDSQTNAARAGCATEPYMGSVCATAGGWCPRGYAEAGGQILAINDYTGLFAVMGCTYGGDCRTTFGLPDLRGRSVVGYGTGPGLDPVPFGVARGRDYVVQNNSQLAPHSHTATFTPSGGSGTEVKVSTEEGTKAEPDAGDYLGQVKAGFNAANAYVPSGSAGTTVSLGGVSGGGGGGGAVTVDTTGQGVEQPNVPPQLSLRYCVAIDGIFPPRPN